MALSQTKAHARRLRPFLLAWAGAGLALAAACGPAAGTPRPRGFARMALPMRAYQRFDHPNCFYTLDYPTYGQVLPRGLDSCFADIYFPQFKATLHLTAHRLGSAEAAASAFEDHRRLVFNHATKASNIFERRLGGPGQAVQGTYYELYGEVPSAAQFFLADSQGSRVVTGALYFRTALKNDSLQPAIDLLRQDMLHMAASLRWNGRRPPRTPRNFYGQRLALTPTR